MKTFSQTSKGKKVIDKQGDKGLSKSSTAVNIPNKENDDDPDNATVMKARDKLKNKLKSSQTPKSTKDTSPIENAKEEKTDRTWFKISDKISKKDMDKIDVSKDKEGGINIEH